MWLGESCGTQLGPALTRASMLQPFPSGLASRDHAIHAPLACSCAWPLSSQSARPGDEWIAVRALRPATLNNPVGQHDGILTEVPTSSIARVPAHHPLGLQADPGRPPLRSPHAAGVLRCSKPQSRTRDRLSRSDWPRSPPYRHRSGTILRPTYRPF
jgi:hypothetical protein